MVQSILTPTDGSDNSYTAVEQAIHLAEPFDATIHAVSVVESIPKRDRLRYDPEDAAEEAVERAKEMVEAAGLEFVGDTMEGLPSEQIIDYAVDNDVDMIVMGTHGRGGVQRVLFGSVAERTVRNSPVPVLTVRPAE